MIPKPTVNSSLIAYLFLFTPEVPLSQIVTSHRKHKYSIFSIQTVDVLEILSVPPQNSRCKLWDIGQKGGGGPIKIPNVDQY